MRCTRLSLASSRKRKCRFIRTTEQKPLIERCVSISPAKSASAKSVGMALSRESPIHPIILRCIVACNYPIGRCIMESHLDIHFDTLVLRLFTARSKSGRASLASHRTCIRRLHATDANTPSSASCFPSALADLPLFAVDPTDVSVFDFRRTRSLSADGY